MDYRHAPSYDGWDARARKMFSYFSELRSAKLECQAEIGDTLSWSEFFRILIDKDLRHLPL